MKDFIKSISSSILFLLLGVFMFLSPNKVVNFINYIVGAVFIIGGIVKIYFYIKSKDKNGGELVSAAIAIILGILIIALAPVFEILVRAFVGGWMLYNGIMNIIFSMRLSEIKHPYWILLLIISILMLICGIYTILEANVVLSGIGLFIIIYSILDIIEQIIWKIETKK